MKARERIDKIMMSCRERMQEEVTALLGKSIRLGDLQADVKTKEEFFEEPAGKSVLAHVQLQGDLAGEGALLVSLKDAIRIGGSLIMLPETELQSVIADEKYTEELEDSYGEIANIICGSITSTVDEQHPKNFRVVRTEQEVILPVKVDIASDQPFPDGHYYVCSIPMEMDNTEMGQLYLVFPAAPLGLVEEEASETVPAAKESKTETPAASPEEKNEADTSQEQVPPVEEEHTVADPVKVRKEAVTNQKIVSKLLKECFDKIGEDVGALIGKNFAVGKLEEGLFTKEDLLGQLGGKQMMARMDVRGEGTGEVFMFAQISSAAYLGGSLIMLPESELKETAAQEELGEDAQDAYEEITNIIAGVYTAVFEEQYLKKIGFVKTATETVIPIKIDPESDETLPSQMYYLASGGMEFDGQDLGLLHVAFPAALFELEALAVKESSSDGTEDPVAPISQDDGVAKVAEQEHAQVKAGQKTPEKVGVNPDSDNAATVVDVLLFSDDDTEVANVGEALQQLGYTYKTLHFKSSVNNYLTGSVRLVFLVMKEISEQGFGVAIKISSAGRPVPLIAAGPAWTRTLVIKAVKYGAVDILVTPSTTEDIREKVEMNLSKIAA